MLNTDIGNLEEEIRDLVADIVEVEPEEVTVEADFVEELGMDSMQALEIMAAIEKKLKIQIPEENLGKIMNMKSLMDLTNEILEKK